MKKILILAVLVCGNVLAGERVILKDSKELSVEVNNTTVLCSSLGYSEAELKINISELNGWTLLDHTNFRVGGTKLPCMSAGFCKDLSIRGEFSVDDVIQGRPGTERIKVTRELVEVREISSEKVCKSNIRESLHTVIRGIDFNHTRTSALKDLPVSACVF